MVRSVFLAALVLLAPGSAGAAERGGFLVGFTLGAGGSEDCGQCELVGGPSFGGHAGVLLTPRLAVLGELSVLAFSGSEDNTAGTTAFVGAVQFWPTYWLWVNAGAGVAEAGSSRFSDGGGPVVVAQAGIDFRGRQRFGLDVRGRYERRVDSGSDRRSVIVSMGFTWY